ncbi:TPA: hypothetical protein VAV59_000144 [Streptococcus agalactiae]|nr:hypothetical protein [Streptococcus agalactiae]MDU5408431.1 hypothetical protein [Streptococcus agalactiae]HEN2236686.1 hypothetical protein [Streptococcus agalactiae]HEN2246901.1 hypothetical protein [Streptococcus agalactiae]HEN8170003.1 hypothetical protein [Streptococcus agalactiae]HEO0491214.1 hypothetical protein [Streptococcus agalactiae]
MVFVSDGSPVDANTLYFGKGTPIFMIMNVTIFIISTLIYSYYYLPKNQGKKWKFNQWKLQKGKKEQLKINYGIIFGLVMLSPVFLVGSIENIFGLIGGVLFTATFTALIVDSLYAAYYIHKYPEYE